MESNPEPAPGKVRREEKKNGRTALMFFCSYYEKMLYLCRCLRKE